MNSNLKAYSFFYTCLMMLAQVSDMLLIFIICMLLDYSLGLATAILGVSKKGKLSSNIGYIGIAKKVFSLFLVIIAMFLDYLTNNNFVITSVLIILIVNEIISISENLILIGIPFPKILTDMLEVVKKGDEK